MQLNPTSNINSLASQANIARMHMDSGTSASFEAMLQSAQEAQEYVAIRNAAQEFEAYFIQTLFREMRRTLNDEDSLIPRSDAEKIFQDMLDEQTARNAAQTGGIGLADTIVRQFIQRPPT